MYVVTYHVAIKNRVGQLELFAKDFRERRIHCLVHSRERGCTRSSRVFKIRTERPRNCRFGFRGRRSRTKDIHESRREVLSIAEFFSRVSNGVNIVGCLFAQSGTKRSVIFPSPESLELLKYSVSFARNGRIPIARFPTGLYILLLIELYDRRVFYGGRISIGRLARGFTSFYVRDVILYRRIVPVSSVLGIRRPCVCHSTNVYTHCKPGEIFVIFCTVC